MAAALEWTTTDLGSVATLHRGYDLPGRLRVDGHIPIISSSGTTDWHNQAMVTAPGVVTGRYGTIGNVFYAESDYWPLNTTLYVSDFHQNEPKFVYYMLQRIDFDSHKGKSGVPGVNRNDLHGLSVVIPTSPAEQKIIATALSDADGLIDSLLRLIAKKEAVKQGMMQELFRKENEWPKSTLAEIADVIDPHPSHRAPAEYANGIPFVGIGDMNLDGSFATDNARRVAPEILLEHEARYRLSEGLIGLGRVASIGKVVRLPLVDGSCVVSPTLGIIRPRTVDFDFLYYTLSTAPVTNQFGKVMSGSTRASVGMEVLRRLVVPHPDSRSDQKRIGAMLVDIDREMEILHNSLRKAKSMKLGMMQELLTGRTRLQPVEFSA